MIMKQQQRQHEITIHHHPIEGWQFNYCTGIPHDGSGGTSWFWWYDDGSGGMMINRSI
jgi:hypothetical protein